KIKPLGRGVTWMELAVAAVLGILPLLLLPVSFGLPALAAGAGASLLAAWSARRLLGGYTGDVLGTVEQTYEIVFLLAAAACV
ncbi:MAG: adenosylcobinamide-GDP ribazoletransferase, partial [Rhodomicrobium sp.]